MSDTLLASLIGANEVHKTKDPKIVIKHGFPRLQESVLLTPSKLDGPIKKNATTAITADALKASGDDKVELEFIPLEQEKQGPKGQVIGKRSYSEIFTEAAEDAARITSLRAMLTDSNKKKFSKRLQRNLERELKFRTSRTPARLADKCPIYSMAAVSKEGGLKLVGYNVVTSVTNEDGTTKTDTEFHAPPVYTVPSGVAPKNGVPRFISAVNVPECSVLEENVFVNVGGAIQQCVTPKCRSLIADVKHIREEEQATAANRVARMLKAIASQAQSKPKGQAATLIVDPSVVRKAIGVTGTSAAADHQFKVAEAERTLKDAIRQAMIAQLIDQGEDPVDARSKVNNLDTDGKIKKHYEDFLLCANAFKDGVPSDVFMAKQNCNYYGEGKCTFYGKSVTTPGGARLPGLCFNPEFTKDGNSSSTKSKGAKAIKVAADLMLAMKEQEDAKMGGNVTLGGGGGGDAEVAEAEDARMAVLRAGTARLAAMSRAVAGGHSISGGATSPYGAHSSRWAM